MEKIWRIGKAILGGTIFGFIVFTFGVGYGHAGTVDYANGNRERPEVSLNPLSWVAHVIWAFSKSEFDG